MFCIFIFIFICADCKRRLIDLWGHSQDWDYSKLTKQQLEKKWVSTFSEKCKQNPSTFFWDRSDYCDHLLGLAAKLSPGHSELRGWDETVSQSYSGVDLNKQMLQVSSLGTTWSSIAARPVGLAEDEVHYPAVHPQPQGALRQPQGDHYHPRAHQGWLRWGSQWTQGWNSQGFFLYFESFLTNIVKNAQHEPSPSR